MLRFTFKMNDKRLIYNMNITKYNARNDNSRNSIKKMLALIILPLVLTFGQVATVLAQKKNVTIAAGSVLEAYYSVALKICDFIKASNKNVGCNVISTRGSIENLALLKKGEVDFALVQSNIATEAFNGAGRYKNTEPYNELRQILNLYDEAFTIIAKDNDKIKVFADIAGKKITAGPADSASRAVYDELLKLYGDLTPTEIDLDQGDYAAKLCSDQIDALVLMVGHHNALVNHIANSCEIDFVSIEQSKIDQIMKENKAFYPVTLLKGTYPGITENQKTIGVAAILVAENPKISSKRNLFEEKVIKNFLKYFHYHKNKFMDANPVFNSVDATRFERNFVLPKYDHAK